MKHLHLLITSAFLSSVIHAQSWNLMGNAGTNPTTHFIGTTDNIPLNFRINSVPAGKIDSVIAAVFFGLRSGIKTYGSNNTAIGHMALTTNTNGTDHTAIGAYALEKSTLAFRNTAIGSRALNTNSSGNDNVAVGHYALYSNSSGSQNVGIGLSALYTNTGSSNVAIGYRALLNNKGGRNTAIGSLAMQSSTGNNSSYNTALGYGALTNTSNSQYNTALGYMAGGSYVNGYNNIFVGGNADVNAGERYNVIVIGQGTIGTANSQVTIGNSATSSYRAYAGWTNISDGRFKKEVKENVPGLDFITRLRPVSYIVNASGLDAFLHAHAREEQFTTDSERKSLELAKLQMKKELDAKEKIIQMGFIAQEVEQSAKEIGLNFSPVEMPKDENDVYGIRYSELVVPLVKAIQEQQEMIASLQNDITLLKQQADVTVVFRETLLSDRVNIYPNPVANNLTVSINTRTSGKGSLQVFDASGKMVTMMSIDVTVGLNSINLPLPVLSSGAYILKVNWGKGLQKQISFVRSN